MPSEPPGSRREKVSLLILMNPDGVCHQSVPQQRTNWKAGKEGRGHGRGAKEKGAREEKDRGEKDKKEGGTYQSARHWGLVILGKMLLQGQDDAVGNDGGQDHVLKWRGKGGVKEQTPQRERDTASQMAVHINIQTLSARTASA